MIPIALAGPAVEPIALAEAKAYLRLDGDAEDELVTALIVAARLTVERQARLCLIEQGWRVRLETWPARRVVPLPLWPVIAVEVVRIVSASGAAAALDPGLYRLQADADPARLLVDAAAPDPEAPDGAVEIDILCGFGAGPAAVPEPLRLAVRRLVASWFETRGDEPRASESALPPGVAGLLAPFRRPRLA